MLHPSGAQMSNTTTITLPPDLAEALRKIAEGTSVSPHRVGVVALAVGLELFVKEPGRLVRELAEAERARRSRSKRRGGTK